MYKRISIAVAACLAFSASQTTTAAEGKVENIDPNDLSFEFLNGPAIKKATVVGLTSHKREVAVVPKGGILLDQYYRGGYLEIDDDLLRNWVNKYARNPSNISEIKSTVLPVGQMTYLTFMDGVNACILGAVNVGTPAQFSEGKATQARLTGNYCDQIKREEVEAKGLALFEKVRLKK